MHDIQKAGLIILLFLVFLLLRLNCRLYIRTYMMTQYKLHVLMYQPISAHEHIMD